ncbi:hypothetical protein KC957_03800 [Candidatus Saccharibacteria bacterium]|nr:hypothetical protein [Candidatus Saccharibacteria bacterium]
MVRRSTHGTRSCLHANPRDHRDGFSVSVVGDEAVPHRGFFVPAFSVRRPLVPNEAAVDFAAKLSDYCRRKPYIPTELGKMGITLLDRSRFEGTFRRVDVQPEAASMLELARNIRDSLAGHVAKRPRMLRVPLGSVAVFGNSNNRISVVPEGWRGYGAAYASRTDGGRVGANHALTREINGVVGEMTQFIDGGFNGSGDYVDVSTRAIQRQTPHLTLATKTRGGSISNNERAEVAGEIESFMPSELKFYDPIIHLNLVTTGKTGAYMSNMGLVDATAAGMFVRTPERTDLEAIGYERQGSGIYTPVVAS